MPPSSFQSLAGIRVLEVAGDLSGATVGWWFAELGAHVTRLALSPQERDAESAESVQAPKPHPEIHTLLGDECDEPWLTAQAQLCDVIIESAAPGPLDPKISDQQAPHAVRVHISPFDPGSDASAWRANGFINEALAGHLLLNGEKHRAPFARFGDLSSHQAALHAFIGALRALDEAQGRRGQLVRVNHHDGLLSIHQHTVTMWTHGNHILSRLGNRQAGYWHPMSVYPCRDGHIVLCAAGQSSRDRLLSALNRPELLLDARFADDIALSQNKDAFDLELTSWLKERTRQEIVDRLQWAGVAASAVQTPEEVLQDPHLIDQQNGQRGLRHSHRALPFRLRDSESNNEVCRTMPALKVGSTLKGARILEIGNIWAGPLAGRILSDLGADVVAVEAPWRRGGLSVPIDLATTTHLFANNEIGDEPWNRIGSVNALMRGKRSLSIDLNHPRALALIGQLIAQADVLIENFAPGSRFSEHFTLEKMKALNPELIWVSISGYGTEGPDRAHLAFGPNIEARAGFTAQGGYPDTGPMRSGVAWPDPIAALTAVAGTLTALRERQNQPHRGVRHVDVSMLESALWIANASGAPAKPVRQGARHPELAPQGIYPCEGIDRWIAISITRDQEWKALCAVLDLDRSWASFELQKRFSQHDSIDQAIAERTQLQDRRTLTERLQAHGVMAGWLSDARDLVSNQETSAESFWIDVIEPDGDIYPAPGLPIRIDGASIKAGDRAPRLGEHNRAVLKEWAGLTETEMDSIEQAGVVANRPPS